MPFYIGRNGTGGGSGSDSSIELSKIPVNHLPMVGSDKKLTDSGVFLDDRNLHLEGKLVLGNSMTVENGVGTISYSLPDGTSALGISSVYDENGTVDPYYFKLTARREVSVSADRGTIIAPPISFSYAEQEDTLYYDFKFIPATAGQMRVKAYLGIVADPAKLIFDEIRTVTQAEVDASASVSFGKGNKFTIASGQRVLVEIDGISLEGAIASTGDNAGKTIPHFINVVHSYRKKPFFDFGWFNYNNSNNTQVVPADVWTTLANDSLGDATYTNFPPDEVSRMLDPTTGRILLDELDVGDEVYIRHTINLMPKANTTAYSFSHYFGNDPGSFRLPIGMSSVLDEGAGTPTGDFVLDTHFFILDDNSRLNGMLPQVLVSNETEVIYKGCYISVTRRA